MQVSTVSFSCFAPASIQCRCFWIAFQQREHQSLKAPTQKLARPFVMVCLLCTSVRLLLFPCHLAVFVCASLRCLSLLWCFYLLSSSLSVLHFCRLGCSCPDDLHGLGTLFTSQISSTKTYMLCMSLWNIVTLSSNDYVCFVLSLAFLIQQTSRSFTWRLSWFLINCSSSALDYPWGFVRCRV